MTSASARFNHQPGNPGTGRASPGPRATTHHRRGTDATPRGRDDQDGRTAPANRVADPAAGPWWNRHHRAAAAGWVTYSARPRSLQPGPRGRAWLTATGRHGHGVPRAATARLRALGRCRDVTSGSRATGVKV